MKVIAVTGKLQNGKDTFGNFIKEKLDGVEVVSFAHKLKEFAEKDFDILAKQVNFQIDELFAKLDSKWYIKFIPFVSKFIKSELEDWKITSDKWYENKNFITRSILQIYGTDIMRKRVDDNFWIDKTISYIDNLKSKGVKYVVITDNRFNNEIEKLKDKYDDVSVVNVVKSNVVEGIESTHESENSLDPDLFTHIIDNDTTLEELEKKADSYIKSIIETIK